MGPGVSQSAHLPAPVAATRLPGHAYQLADAFAGTGRKAKNTREAYRLDLFGCSKPLGECLTEHEHLPVAWLPWCDQAGLDPLDDDHVRPAVLLAWTTALERWGDSESTRSRRLSCVGSWYRYLLRESVVSRNPVAVLLPEERPRSSAQIHETSPLASPSRKQVEALLRAADVDSPRSAAVISLLVCTGIRVSAAVDADEDDLGTVQVIDDLGMVRDHRTLWVTLKGGKRKQIALPPLAWHRLEAHLAGRPRETLPAVGPGTAPRRPLIVRSTGRRMTRQEVNRLVRRIADKAGLSDIDLSPHCLRLAYIGDLLADGVSLRDVQLAVGHRDPRTTARYDNRHLSPDRDPSYRRAAQFQGLGAKAADE
jgi:site-specific recombinase XerD